MYMPVIRVMQNFNNGHFHVNIIVEVGSNNLLSFTLIILFLLECGNVFCSDCANYSKIIPSLHLTRSVRVCRDCFSMNDESHSSTNIEPTPPISMATKNATPMPIQNGCRQSNGTPNGSFNSPGGQKVKG